MSVSEFEQIKGRTIKLFLQDAAVEGVLHGILLSSNPNPQNGEPLPVSMLMNDVSISLFKVKQLVVLE